MFTITLDGIDISARCSTSIAVGRGEGGAATATFIYAPTTTPLLPTDMIRKPATIEWDSEMMFTGKVAEARWDLYSRTYSITCSDLLQEVYEGMTDAQILSAIPGSVYSISLFGEREDGWRFALDAVSTVPSETHLTRAGFLEVVDWAAKVTPDRTYTHDKNHSVNGGQILNNGEYSLQLAEAREIVTQRNIKYQYRVSRWKMRTHGFSWAGLASMGNWCDWVQDSGWFVPNSDTIRSAAAGTQWTIRGNVGLKGHPPSGVYCSSDVNWLNDIDTGKAISASWNGTRHWSQTVDETYEITVNCTGAQAAFGVVAEEEEFASEIKADDTGFESGPSEVADAWGTDAINDKFQDQDDNARRTNDLLAGIGLSVTAIWGSLRKNYVTVEVPIDPTLGLDETIRITTPDIDCQGKIHRIEHSITQTLATTRITVAISRGGGGTGDTVFAPSRPDSSPTHGTPSASTALSTYVGGCSDSANYDPLWEGWSTIVPQSVTKLVEDPDNPGEWLEIVYTRPACSTPAAEPTADQLYPLRFQVKGPDIEDESRDDVEVTQLQTFDIAVPDDLLVLY